MLLLITLLWPIIFLGGATDALRWAHCISGCCCRLLHFGPLYFWRVLPVHSDGPIALVDATANYFAWAHQISGRYCRCTQMGMLLPIALLGPIRFLGGTANALRWAHCIGRC